MTRIRISEAARADIRAIYRNGVVTFGLAQADVYSKGLKEVIARLALFPESAPVREGIVPPVRATPFRSHIVVYRLYEHDVQILRVRHAAEDWSVNPVGEHR